MTESRREEITKIREEKRRARKEKAEARKEKIRAKIEGRKAKELARFSNYYTDLADAYSELSEEKFSRALSTSLSHEISAAKEFVRDLKENIREEDRSGYKDNLKRVKDQRKVLEKAVKRFGKNIEALHTKLGGLGGYVPEEYLTRDGKLKVWKFRRKFLKKYLKPILKF